MKFAFRGASGAALLLGISGSLQSAWAQQGTTAPAPQTVTTTQQTTPPATGQAASEQTAATGEQAPTDRVVITGSLIATTLEDAPIPIEVFSATQLEEAGAPNATEFIRSLTMVTEGAGESSVALGSAAAGFSNVNMRGIGSDRTLTLMNGRRFGTSDREVGSDLNTVPMAALGQVEVLKDGASATYGAGAVGGVINFVTRRDIDGVTLTAEHKTYEGSRGETEISLLTGWVGDSSNFLLTGTFVDVGSLNFTDRDFSQPAYDENTTLYATTPANPANYFLATPGARFVAATPSTTLAPTVSPTVVRDYTTASCRAIGGETRGTLDPSIPTSTVAATAATANNCAFISHPFFNLVENSQRLQFYAEFNAQMTDTMEFHAEATYAKVDTPEVFGSPSMTAGAAARAILGPTSATCVTTVSQCQYAIPVSTALVTTAGAATTTFVRNPFINDFYARNSLGAAPSDAVGGLVYTGVGFRPFGYGGNPYFGGGSRKESRMTERVGIVAQLKGEFAENTFFGSVLPGISYDTSMTYNMYFEDTKAPDIAISRLQNALRGYGGPSCQAVDRVATDFTNRTTFDLTIGIQSDTAPGQRGCEWFNPFASSFQRSAQNGALNPAFNAGTLPGRPEGYQNSVEMIDWMMLDRYRERLRQSLTFDSVYTGEVPGFELPGGPIGWAAGTQWRQTERHDVVRTPNLNEERLTVQQCAWNDPAQLNGTPAAGGGLTLLNETVQKIGSLGCGTTVTGAFIGSARLEPTEADRQFLSFFTELQLPILDNLDMQLALRNEDYGGTVDGQTYKIAAKYDITDSLSVRASFSNNTQAPPDDLLPGEQIIGTVNAFSTTIPAVTTTAQSVGQEEDLTTNIGVIWEPQVGDARMRFGIDFFEIVIRGEDVTTPSATIFTNVFGGNTGAAASAFANCSAALRAFVTFANGNGCTQGTTTAADVLLIELNRINGPGFTTNGVDYSADISYPLLDGRISASAQATNVMVYKTKGYKVNDIVFTEGGNRLGYANLSRDGDFSSRWRGNVSLRYVTGDHRFNLRMNYVDGVIDESGGAIIRSGVTPVVRTTYGVSAQDYKDFDFNYIYTAPFWEELELRFSVLNLTNEDPMVASNALTFNGYFTGIGNPRGRQFEFGITKKF